jgi:hypothetical protein
VSIYFKSAIMIFFSSQQLLSLERLDLKFKIGIAVHGSSLANHIIRSNIYAMRREGAYLKIKKEKLQVKLGQAGKEENI